MTRFDGTTVVLRTAGARVVPIEMNWRQRVLSAVAHPKVAFILLSLGTLGLTIELWSPGAVLPGVAGGLCLLLAFFALQILPVNYAGLLLILFGLSLLMLEVKIASYGLLTAGGLASLLFGSMILTDSSVPELQVSLRLVLPIVLGVAGIAVFLARMARRLPATPPCHGRRSDDRRGRTRADRHRARRGRTRGDARRDLDGDRDGTHRRRRFGLRSRALTA